MRTVSTPAANASESIPAIEPTPAAEPTQVPKPDGPGGPVEEDNQAHQEADKKADPDTVPVEEEKPAAAPEDKPVTKSKGKGKKRPAETKDANEDATDDKKTKEGKARKMAKTPKGEPKQREPARPYRKLAQEILDSRIEKLTRRVERTSKQAAEGKTFLDKYIREQCWRAANKGKAEPTEPVEPVEPVEMVDEATQLRDEI